MDGIKVANAAYCGNCMTIFDYTKYNSMGNCPWCLSTSLLFLSDCIGLNEEERSLKTYKNSNLSMAKALNTIYAKSV